MKKILLSIGSVAIAATMVFNTTLGITGNKTKMSALMLANVEALARKEDAGEELPDYEYQWVPVDGGVRQCCVPSVGGYCFLQYVNGCKVAG